MIVTSADQVQPHVQTVTTYAADFDEVQTIELDGDDVNEWQYAFIDVASTVYESQVSGWGLLRLFPSSWFVKRPRSHMIDNAKHLLFADRHDLSS